MSWALSLPQPFQTSINAGAGGYFSPIIRRYMMMTGYGYDFEILEGCDVPTPPYVILTGPTDFERELDPEGV